MLAAAGHFNADDFTVVIKVNPVVIVLTFVLAVHDFITSSLIVDYPKYSIRSY